MQADIDRLANVECQSYERRILMVLRQRFPNAVSTDALFDALYGASPDGGPLSGVGVVRVYVSHLRRKLAPHGWTIPNHRGGHGCKASYRLKMLVKP